MGLAANPITAVVLLLLLSILAAPPPVSAKLKTTTISFNNFTFSDPLKVDSAATISYGALKVTLDTANSAFSSLTNQSGRILYNTPFQLWEGKNDTFSDRVASFNASFLVNIYRLPDSTTPGEGLTFVVAPDLNVPLNSYGEYLGLTNATTDGNVSNRILAVELDTFKEDFDPDANHVGLNINSVRSNKTTSLTQLGFELVGPNETANFFNIWVQYDGVKKVIEVYIAQQANKTDPTPPRPANPILNSTLELRGLVNQVSYFGFSSSTSNFTELNCVLRWNLTVEHYSDEKQLITKIALAAGIPAVVLLAAAAVAGYFLRKRWLARSNPQILGALKSLPGTPREFQYKDLLKATNKFDEKRKLGQGGFGVVYKGYLANEDLVVAVKVFTRESLKGEDDFLAELTIINRLRHKHLVRLLGWCHKHGKLLLVYEYMPNGSLDKHLFSDADSKPLSWTLRLKIISGVAAALNYLHNEYDQKVVHRDLKASNVLLDSDFNARLGDFGLAWALENEKTSYAEAEGIMGTLGYIAPECFHTGKATQQSDVYAFGAVLLEVVCGFKPGTRIGGYQFLVDWVWALHHEGQLLEAVDNRLGEDNVAEEVQRFLLLGLACSHPTASERPKTQDIVQMLSGSMPVPYVPPFRPAYMSPWVPMGDEDIHQTIITDTTSLTWALDNEKTSYTEVGGIPGTMGYMAPDTTFFASPHYGSDSTSLAINSERQRRHSDSFNGAHLIGQDQSGSTASHSGKKRTRQIENGKWINSSISLEDLQQHFGRKRKDAAESLGVSVSTFKRICRQHGIEWWPTQRGSRVLKPPDPAERNASSTFKTLSTHGHTEMENEMVGHHLYGMVNEMVEFPSDFCDGPNSWNIENGSLANILGTPAFHDPSAGNYLDHMGISVSSVLKESGIATGSCGRSFQQKDQSTLSTPCPNGNAILFPQPQVASTAVMSSGNMGSSDDCRYLLAPQAEARLEGHGSGACYWTMPTCCDLASSQLMPTTPYTTLSIPHMTPPLTEQQDMRSAMIKAIYGIDGNNIIKFQLPLSSGILGLKEEVSKRLKFEHDSFDVKYKDEYGDFILIACDEDLRDCLKLFSSLSNQEIRLWVFDKFANTGNFCKNCRSIKRKKHRYV
ncbi:hypothetical protein RHMOL_Rhmol10G0275700 [Rhododendron molle]|uniref:Uncharacterized protein n=1 Tax=Rhododendron molle TaxID=49168 RepID=A0ACC0M711_RHOML|nr:hypothetical protein RHMOL_Rhmol10G0275700 [Rhododendron molle]